jgi:ABC-type Na+ efflux pump permease subunit
MVVNTERVDSVVTERDALAGDEVMVAKPDGPLAAALLAAGIGAFALGLLTTLAEASSGFRDRLVLNAGVGPLSGKTVWANVIFLVAWALLAARLRDRDGLLRSATTIFVVLTLLGLLGTFPIFFQAFAPE